MYNNDARKKQKATVAVGNGGDSSLPIPVVVVPCSALSFGNILKEFPDLLFVVLPYITDRVIWNSIAASNKDMHAKSKAIRPPWPLCYNLQSDDDYDSYSPMAWSPCGTRLAFPSDDYIYIQIIDQRRGPFRNNGNDNNGLGWLANDHCVITDLKFSPDGRYLVSAGRGDFIRLWDNITGNYEQLQEWDMSEEVGAEELQLEYIEPIVSISACSKYVVVSLETWVFFKDVENGGKTISFIALNENRIRINNIMFSSKDRAIFICCQQYKTMFIKVWHPYLDDDDKDNLVTLWRQTDLHRGLRLFTFSHDTSMVVIRNKYTEKGTLWSIDTDHKYLTKKFDFHGSGSTGLHFAPDGKYIVFNERKGRPTLWSIAEGTYTNNTIFFLDNGSNYTKHNDCVVKSFSPNNQQFIVRDPDTRKYCITSYFVN